MKTAKPKKPYPEFPLFAHQAKQWAKKIKGKMWYFGVWDDPMAALEKYNQDIHEIQAGRDPRRTRAHVSSGELSVYDLANLYLARHRRYVLRTSRIFVLRFRRHGGRRSYGTKLVASNPVFGGQQVLS